MDDLIESNPFAEKEWLSPCGLYKVVQLDGGIADLYEYVHNRWRMIDLQDAWAHLPVAVRSAAIYFNFYSVCDVPVTHVAEKKKRRWRGR